MSLPIEKSNFEGKDGQINKDGERHIEAKTVPANAFYTYTGREESGNCFGDNELDASKHHGGSADKKPNAEW